MLYGSNGGVLVTPPGRARSWVDLLPHPWRGDPPVVVVLVPTEAKIHIKVDSEGKYALTVMEYEGRQEGLQVTQPDIPVWSEQAFTFRRAGIRIREPAWIGRLSGVPSKYLVQDAHPIAYLRDDMSGEWLNLRLVAMPPGTQEERKERWS